MRKILVFQNGMWKPMPHDNFLINVANRQREAIRPLEKRLAEGQVVHVGGFTFKQAKDKHIAP